MDQRDLEDSRTMPGLFEKAGRFLHEPGAEIPHDCDRREFMRRTAALSALAALGVHADQLLSGPPVAATPTSGPTVEDEGERPVVRANAPPPSSTVVQVVSPKIIPLRTVQRPFLKDCLALGLCRLTGEADPRDAWHKLLKPEDVILIKFNQSGAREMATTPPMAAELLDSLAAAGWPPEQIMMLEAPPDARVLKKTRPVEVRWQGEEVEFGECGKDALIAALAEATAIINVPFLKTHHLATMTGCLKNLSHGLIRHPARFHEHGCDPAITEIYSTPEIKGKVRLHITNALRVAFDGGPEVNEDTLQTMGTLLLSTDPVASDATGFGVLNEARSLRGLGPLISGARAPKVLVTAARRGLGQLDRDKIDLRRVEV